MPRSHVDERSLRRGFVAMTPLWLGVVPFGLAFAVTARDAGFSLVETQALSLFLFAGSAQFSTVDHKARRRPGRDQPSRRCVVNPSRWLIGNSREPDGVPGTAPDRPGLARDVPGHHANYRSTV
jgi:hypothetical protein